MRATMIAKTVDAITCRRLDRSPAPARKYADGARPFGGAHGGEGGIAAAVLAAGPSGPTLRVVQNRSRRFCRTRRVRPRITRLRASPLRGVPAKFRFLLVDGRLPSAVSEISWGAPRGRPSGVIPASSQPRSAVSGRRDFREASGGEGGIRTHEHPLRCYWNSSPAPSTARPPLRSITYDSPRERIEAEGPGPMRAAHDKPCRSSPHPRAAQACGVLAGCVTLKGGGSSRHG